MKTPFCVLFTIACISLLLVIGSPAVTGQSVPYSTSFEAPVFSLGPVDGQDGWTGDGNIQNASSQFIKSGTQSLAVDENGRVSRYFIDVPTGSVFIDGYYRDTAVDIIPDVTSLEDGTSFVLFHQTNGIMALDGDGDGGGAWVSSGIQVATDTLQRVTIAQDYESKVWVLYIDEQPVSYQGQTPYHFGFRDDSIISFCGIDIDSATTGAGFVDDFSVSFNWPDFLLKQTPPDILVYSFLQEWFYDGDDAGLTWDLTPGEGETNKVDALDLLDLLSEFSPSIGPLKVKQD
jgi:hypothetical protein